MNQKKLILAATIGNCFEVYDFIIYQIMAIYISKYFLGSDYSMNFFMMQAIYAVSIISRPLGGMILGYLSDTRGRKYSLEYSILISGLSTSAIAFIPPHSSIGNWSIFFLVLSRFFQGFSLGGEQGVSLAFLCEHSSPKHRGFISSFACVGQNLGFLIAIIISTIYMHTNHFYFNFESWKFVFLLSMFIGIFGYWIRKKTTETLDFISNISNDKKIKSIKQFFSAIDNFNTFILSYFLVAFGTLMNLTLVLVIPKIIHNSNNLNYFNSLYKFIIPCVIILFIPIFGLLSDKIGRKKIITYSMTITPVLLTIFFEILNKNSIIILTILLLCIACSAFIAVTPTFIIEKMPKNLKCTSFALIYGIPAAVTGAVGPELSKLLVEYNPLFFIFTVSIICISAILFLRRTTDPINDYKKINKYSYEFLKP